ncbi:MAG TPA: molybdopterin oxidoreductase, partial [Thermoplasmata archaeon]|nr:molybdopterin oxidoreductase [Thermoplasmata archaeon]
MPTKKAKFDVTKRQFLRSIPPAAATILAARYLPEVVFAGNHLKPIDPNLNPLENYPNRGWENAYRDLYGADSSFVYLCAPNDTHGCLLRAHVKNGVVKYVDPTFGYGKTTDLYGNRISARWDPRICNSGHAYLRRYYSDRRLKGAYVRKGFKDWIEAGMPRQSDGLPERKYFVDRGKDPWVKTEWSDAFALVAKTLVDVAKTYTGDEGRARLTAQGYDPAMVDATKGHGIQTLKFRASMAWLSTMRFTGLYRFANSLALLDSWIRNVPPAEAD